jgi:hypothetical protein
MTPPTDARLREWYARSPFKDELDDYVLELAEQGRRWRDYALGIFRNTASHQYISAAIERERSGK